MSQINLVEPNILCSLYHLELPPEIVQRLYTEYIIDFRNTLFLLFLKNIHEKERIYPKIVICSRLYKGRPKSFSNVSIEIILPKKLKSKNNKYTKKDIYHQNKARLKLKNY